MIKTAFAAAAAAAAFAAPGAALAGPYVNVETNAGWTGADYTGAATDFHVGYEDALGECCLLTTSKSVLLWSPLTAVSLIPSLQVRQALALLLPTLSEHMVRSPSSAAATVTSTVDTAVSSV